MEVQDYQILYQYSHEQIWYPINCWLLCLIYVCHLLNHIAFSALDGKMPIFALTGITPDIFIILLFTFYQPAFYATYDQTFPSESEERPGYWVGIGDHCGDAMTHKRLDYETHKLSIELLLDPRSLPLPTIGLHHMEGRFLHLLTLLKIKFPLDDHLDRQKVPLRDRRPLESSSGPEMKRIHLDPSLYLPLTPVTSLVEHSSYLLRRMGRGIEPRLPDRLLQLLSRAMAKRVENINFISDIGNGKVEELISYNQLLELYWFRAII